MEAQILWNESKRQPQASPGQDSDSLVWGRLGKDWWQCLEFRLWPEPASAGSPPQPEPCLDNQPHRLFLFQLSSFLYSLWSEGDSLERTSGPSQKILAFSAPGMFQQGEGMKEAFSVLWKMGAEEECPWGSYLPPSTSGCRQLWKQFRQVTFS